MVVVSQSRTSRHWSVPPGLPGAVYPAAGRRGGKVGQKQSPPGESSTGPRESAGVGCRYGPATVRAAKMPSRKKITISATKM